MQPPNPEQDYIMRAFETRIQHELLDRLQTWPGVGPLKHLEIKLSDNGNNVIVKAEIPVFYASNNFRAVIIDCKIKIHWSGVECLKDAPSNWNTFSILMDTFLKPVAEIMLN